jgi:hypothetical protein
MLPRYCSKAVALGGEWISYNVMTERLEILHLERQHSNIMSESWKLYMEESTESSSTSPSDQPGQQGKKDEIVQNAGVKGKSVHDTEKPSKPQAKDQYQYMFV